MLIAIIVGALFVILGLVEAGFWLTGSFWHDERKDSRNFPPPR